MDSVKIALAAGLTLLALAIVLTLTQAPASLARRNTHEDQVLGTARHGTSICQSNEVLPRGTSAIRAHMFAQLGPRVSVRVLERGRVIAAGQQGAGWTGAAVTLPVHPLPTSRSGVTLCLTLALNGDETVQLLGEQRSASSAAREGEGALPGPLTIEYLRPGSSSWWSLLPEVARRAGLGHAPSGTWSVVLVAAVMAGVLALCSALAVRELR
jgi:hypothetical protein